MQPVSTLFIIIGATALFHYISLIAVTRHRFKKYGIKVSTLQLMSTPVLLSHYFIRGLFVFLHPLTIANKKRIMLIALLAYPVLVTLLAAYIQATGQRTFHWKDIKEDTNFIQASSQLFN